MSDILLKRICRLIGMSYAMDEQSVWEIYQGYGSIDKTIEFLHHLKNPFEQVFDNK